jgi:hypothetical protein
MEREFDELDGFFHSPGRERTRGKSGKEGWIGLTKGIKIAINANPLNPTKTLLWRSLEGTISSID